jgi:hypothetical protein
VALAVIQVDKFAIGRIVADHDVQVAVAIDVGQRRRIGAVGRRPQVTGDEAAMAIVQKHAIEEGPMPPFAENNVREAVSVDVAPRLRRPKFRLSLQAAERDRKNARPGSMPVVPEPTEQLQTAPMLASLPSYL